MLPEFIRNKNAPDLFESFLISSVSSILIIRFFLKITGYPQIGSDTLHIAHMLWGGFLMAVALIFTISFLGRRIRRNVAIVGGIGFGIFIDELGKFITSDNNYFFQPTIALMYFVFLTLFFLFRYVHTRKKFSEKEFLMNALELFEETVSNDMDKTEKKELLAFLKEAEKESDHKKITSSLYLLVESIPPVELQKPTGITLLVHRIRTWVHHMIENDLFQKGILIVLVIGALLGLIDLVREIVMTITIDPATVGYDKYTVLGIGKLVCATCVTILAFLGAYNFRHSMVKGLQLFKYSMLVSVLTVQFFNFYYEQFYAIFTLIINVILIAIVNQILDQKSKRRLLE